jgi:hypothetical protein
MRNKFFILAVLFCVVFVFCNSDAKAEAKDIDAKIKTASSYLLAPEDCGKNAKKGFLLLMEAIVSAVPRAGCPEQFNKKIISANDLFRKNGIFDRKGVELLNDAYRSINDGKAFRMPEHITRISQAVEYAKKIVEKARENLKHGNTRVAVKLLAETAVMVVTPKTS